MQNSFHQWKLNTKTNKLSDFYRIFKVRSCWKNKTKIITVRKTLKMRFHSSVASLEECKSESGVKTTCYKFKKNTIEMLLEWFLTTQTAATNPRISMFTLSLLKIRAVFLMFPNVCFLFSRNWKKISTNGFHHWKLHLKESLSLDYERNWTKLRYWKIVANEKCTAEIGEIISVKNLLWANPQKRLEIVLSGKYLVGVMSLKRWIDDIQPFWRTKEEMAKKTPKLA